MRVEVKYGRGAVPVEIPAACRVDVVRPKHVPGLPDPTEAVHAALEAPIGSQELRTRLKPANTVGIVFSDATRPVPNRLVLPPILAEVDRAGVPREAVTLFGATGTHRPNTREELKELLGEEIVSEYRIEQNACTDESGFVEVGMTESGNRIRLNRSVVECDMLVLTGYIEPHFFAGFSGGAKAIMPGCASLDTIMRNHGAHNLDDRYACFGELDRNPIAREIREAGRMVPNTFLVNVGLNSRREITAVFAGDVEQAHRRGCDFVGRHALCEVDRLYDMVITSNAGYPLDRNLYQSVKGMSAAARVLRPGGSLLVCAECRDGVPSEGNFGRILASEPSNDLLLRRIRGGNIAMQDVWQVQILCGIAERAELLLFCEGLGEAEIAAAHCTPVRDLGAAVEERVAASARTGADENVPATVCVLPDGPETIPIYAGASETDGSA